MMWVSSTVKTNGITATASEHKSNDGQYEDGQLKFDTEDYEGIEFTQSDVLCNVQEKAGISSSWILLDSQSTVDVFSNSKILGNI